MPHTTTITTPWAALAAPIPAEQILQRSGSGGRMLDYIDRPLVWQRLDESAEGQWSATFTVLPNTASADEPYAMLCHLTVCGVVREGVGQGSDYKSAETDAFKRAAVHFGIGRQLYGTVGTAKPAPAPAPRAATPRPAAKAAAPKTNGTAHSSSTDVPACPTCGGEMWDNRKDKTNPKSPDFKCKDKTCLTAKGYVTSVWAEPSDVATPVPVGAGFDGIDDLPF